MTKNILQTMIIAPVFLAGATLSSCGESNRVNMSLSDIPTSSITTVTDTAFRTFNITENDDPSFLEKEVEEISVIPLETTDESTIGRIDAVKFVNDTIVVIDAGKAQRIFLFDRYGKFLRSIGGKGEGPGEYGSINSLNIDDKGIEIIDWISQKWLRYDYSGSCVQEKTLTKVRPQNMAVLNDSTAVGTFAGYFENEPYQLAWIRNDSVINTALPFESKRSKPAGVFINGTDGTLKFIPHDCDTVYRVEPDGLVALFSLGLYRKDEMKNFYDETATLSEAEYNERLFSEDGTTPVNMIDFKELPDKWIVTHQKNRNQWISVINRNSGHVKTYTRSNYKNRCVPVPFLLYINSDNTLSSFISEEFGNLRNDDKERVFAKIKDSGMADRIRNFDFEKNNPIICRIILK